jgi:enoyl-CoA hydratase
MPHPVTVETSDSVAVIRMDDGKANAISPAMLESLGEALDHAERDRLAVVLAGRDGRFSGGFDLGVMKEGGGAGRALVVGGGRLSLRLGRHPGPVVAACTGHALAMGAVLLVAADLRIGADGPYKIGFNEVAIGLTTPLFLIDQARERLSKRHFQRATVQAQVYDPPGALDAGFFDQIVDADRVVEIAVAEATRLAALPRQAFVATRERARGAVLDRIEAEIESDVAAMIPD